MTPHSSLFDAWPGVLYASYVPLILLVFSSSWLLHTVLQLRKRFIFLKSGMSYLTANKDAYMDTPFRMTTALGDVTILPPSLIPDIRNLADLSFREAITITWGERLIETKEFHASLPGFETFGFVKHPVPILQKVARKQLTQYTNKILEPLSSEAAFATDLIFGNNPGLILLAPCSPTGEPDEILVSDYFTDWQQIPVKDAMLDMIGRLSSRVFLGPDMCRSDRWLRIIKEFTTTAFAAAGKLNMFPASLRPLINLLDPSCRRVRSFVSEARQTLHPAFESRRKAREAAQLAGKPKPAFHDTIEWAEAESQGMDYDPVLFQLIISFVAIHTTYDLLGRALILLAAHPETIDPLRQEMIHVLLAEGWSKTSLNRMKLLDSAVKEAQRIWPASLLTLRRVAVKDVTLSDGTHIRRGERTYTHCLNMMDPKVYPDPEEFDIFRFKKLREQSGDESRAQLVTTTPEQVGFGYGVFACPGRFFAANEMKIALCHLLLKYDWKITEGFKPLVIGDSSLIDPVMTVAFRRRREEIDLESLQFEGVAPNSSVQE